MSGWKQVASRVRYQMSNTNISMLAAGSAFWAFLALFPALIAIVTVWGMFASPSSVTDAVSHLGSSVSPSAKQSLTNWMNQIVVAHQGTLGVALVISLVALLWSVSGAVQNLMTGVTAAYEQEETRGFIARRGTALLLSLGAIVLAILIGINFLANRRNKRWDLTAAKQFTLSDQTKKVLQSLQKPVAVRVFARTEDFDRFRARLDEYRYVSNKLSVEYVDVERRPAVANQYGVQQVGTVVFDYDGRIERVRAGDVFLL